MDRVSPDAAAYLERPANWKLPRPRDGPIDDAPTLFAELLRVCAGPESRVDVVLRIPLGQPLPAGFACSSGSFSHHVEIRPAITRTSVRVQLPKSLHLRAKYATGEPGIGPGPSGPKPLVLPLHHSPLSGGIDVSRSPAGRGWVEGAGSSEISQ